MKKLLLLISVLLATTAYCQEKKATLPAIAATPTGKATASGKTSASGTSSKRIAMRRKKKRKAVEVTHTAPQQERIDSIKKAKTATKK